MNLFRNLYKDLEAEKDLLARNPQGSAGRRDTLQTAAAEPTNV